MNTPKQWEKKVEKMEMGKNEMEFIRTHVNQEVDHSAKW